MRYLLFIPALLLAALLAGCQSAGAIDHYRNPVDVPVADPQVLNDGEMYYLYGTTFGHRGVEVYSSPDLVHWRREGFCLRKEDVTWGEDHFWAPEAVRLGEKYLLFYTAYNEEAGVRNICVGTADSPVGPFEEAVAPLLPANRGYIDPHPFRDPQTGEWYLYAMEENERPPDIVVTRLSSSLRSTEGEITKCLTATQPWERGWVEGPFVTYHKGTYYMMYSGYGYSSPDYAVGYATAPSPTGPWKKFEGNPILKKLGGVSGPGHNSLVRSPDGEELFTAYHRHLDGSGGEQRELALDRVSFKNTGGGPELLFVEGPTTTLQPFPSGSPPHARGRSDEFEGETLDFSRWMSYGENRENWRVEDGALLIETEDGDIWSNRWDARNIFLQYAPPGDFAVETRVRFTPQQDFEQAFLILWQDQGNYLRFSTVYSGEWKLDVAQEVDGDYEADSIANPFGEEVFLRIEKRGRLYQFFASGDGSRWQEIGKPRTMDLRQVKAGIGAIAPASGKERTARFEYFRFDEN